MKWRMLWILFLGSNALTAELTCPEGYGTTVALESYSKGAQDPILSPSGQYLTFMSTSPELVNAPLASKVPTQVFVKRLSNNTMVHASSALKTQACYYGTEQPLNETYGIVVFQCVSDQLEVYAYFLNSTLGYPAGSTVKISVSQTGGKLNGPSQDSGIAQSAPVLYFKTAATNVLTGTVPTPAGIQQIYVVDLRDPGRKVRRVSELDGMPANGSIFTPNFNADASQLAFPSTATNLAPVPTRNKLSRLIQLNMTTGKFYLIGQPENGEDLKVSPWDCNKGECGSFGPWLAQQSAPSMVAYYTQAINVQNGVSDGNGELDIVLADLTGKSTVYVTRQNGATAPGQSDGPLLSPDNRVVVFTRATTEKFEINYASVEEAFRRGSISPVKAIPPPAGQYFSGRGELPADSGLAGPGHATNVTLDGAGGYKAIFSAAVNGQNTSHAFLHCIAPQR